MRFPMELVFVRALFLSLLNGFPFLEAGGRGRPDFRGREGSTMTQQKHLKQLVRARMQKTGESYATARRLVVRHAPAAKPAGPIHLAGSIPATTALRAVVSHAGIVDPHTNKPFTEAMLFGIAGGIGAGKRLWAGLVSVQAADCFPLAEKHVDGLFADMQSASARCTTARLAALDAMKKLY